MNQINFNPEKKLHEMTVQARSVNVLRQKL